MHGWQKIDWTTECIQEFYNYIDTIANNDYHSHVFLEVSMLKNISDFWLLSWILSCLMAGLYLKYVARLSINKWLFCVFVLVIYALMYNLDSFQQQISVIVWPVVLAFGLTWYSKLKVLLSGVAVLPAIIASLAVIVLYRMLVNEVKHVKEIFNARTKKKGLAICSGLAALLNLSFCLCLMNYYHQIPWYGHVLHLGLALLFSGLAYKYNHAGNASYLNYITGIFKECFKFLSLAAHFIAEGSIAAIQSIPSLRMPSVFVAVFAEGTLDLDAVMGATGDHNNDNGNNEDSDKGFSHNNKVQSLWCFLALFYAASVAAIGYFEVPEALRKLFPNLQQKAVTAINITIISLGFIACWLVAGAIASGGDHGHESPLGLKDVFSMRGFLSFFGAILTSVVGATLASSIFNLPLWLYVTIALLAFTVEFSFYFASMLAPKYIPGVVPVANFANAAGEKIVGVVFSCFCPQGEKQEILPTSL